MAFKPTPVELCCTQCRWRKVIAPNSDVMTSDSFFNECPECGGALSSKQLNGALSNLMQLLKIN